MKTLNTKIKLISAGLILAMGVASNAIAVTIEFSGTNDGIIAQTATDGSGLTSGRLANGSNLTDGSDGFFVETFDQATQTLQPEFVPDLVNGGFMPNPSFPGMFPTGDITFNDNINGDNFDDTCAINGTGSGIIVRTNEMSPSVQDPNAFGVRAGSVSGRAKAPNLTDESCFGFTPRERASLPSWVEVDYTVFLSGLGDTGITYLGFLWGSIDTYNDFTFFSGTEQLSTIKGTELVASVDAQGNSGQTKYVGLDFSFADRFDRVRITSTDVAGEFDNIVIGLSGRPTQPVPAPTGIALLAAGLLGLGLRKRLRK